MQRFKGNQSSDPMLRVSLNLTESTLISILTLLLALGSGIQIGINISTSAARILPQKNTAEEGVP